LGQLLAVLPPSYVSGNRYTVYKYNNDDDDDDDNNNEGLQVLIAVAKYLSVARDEQTNLIA